MVKKREDSMSKKVYKKDIERFEKTAEKLESIMESIKGYCPNAELVCFPTSGDLSIIYNNGEADLYDCDVAVSVPINCNACS